MVKLAAALVLAGTFLTSSGCCWPLEEGRGGRHRHDDTSRWSRGDGDRDEGGWRGHDRGDGDRR
jgi:hypothetical protein